MQINKLLNLARFSIHFWELVTKQSSKNNPGTSLLSWCVVRLDQYLIIVYPDEINACIDECNDFLHSEQNLTYIYNWISTQLEELNLQTQLLKNTNFEAKFSYLKLQISKLNNRSIIDITEYDSIEFLQSLINIKQLIN